MHKPEPVLEKEKYKIPWDFFDDKPLFKPEAIWLIFHHSE